MDRHETSDQIRDWNLVKSPLREDPEAQSLFRIWQAKLYAMPSAESPIYLDVFKEERQGYKDLIRYAQLQLGDSIESLRIELTEKLKRQILYRVHRSGIVLLIFIGQTSLQSFGNSPRGLK